MSDQTVIQQSNEELITTLGEEYWKAAWRLMERCNKKETEIPTVEIPLFAALMLAEKGGSGKMRKLSQIAKSNVLGEVKNALDLFMIVEKAFPDDNQAKVEGGDSQV